MRSRGRSPPRNNLKMAFRDSVAQLGLVTPWDDSIQAAANGEWERIALIKGIISQESQWNEKAIRREPQLNDASYGLMQVLLKTAQGIDPTMSPALLLDGPTNIRVGSQYLDSAMARWPILTDAVSAYNGGHPLKQADGSYANQAYVNAVMQYFVYYQNNLEGAAVTGSTDIPAGAPTADSIMSAGGIGMGLAFAAALFLWKRQRA